MPPPTAMCTPLRLRMPSSSLPDEEPHVPGTLRTSLLRSVGATARPPEGFFDVPAQTAATETPRSRTAGQH